MNNPACPCCQQTQYVIKGGLDSGRTQCYRCQRCRRSFRVEYKQQGYDLSLHKRALDLYMEGKSFHAIGRLLGVSCQSVSNWIADSGLQKRSVKSSTSKRSNYSADLRQQVLQALDQGVPRAQVAALFQVSRSNIKWFLKQRRQCGGTWAPKPPHGRTAKYGNALDAGLPAQLVAHDSATLQQHSDLWEQAHGQRVCTATISRAIARLGWTRTKGKWLPPSAADSPLLLGAIMSPLSVPST